MGDVSQAVTQGFPDAFPGRQETPRCPERSSAPCQVGNRLCFRNDEGLPCSNPEPMVQAVGTYEASSLFPAMSLLCRQSQADWQVETMEVVAAGLG